MDSRHVQIWCKLWAVVKQQVVRGLQDKKNKKISYG